MQCGIIQRDEIAACAEAYLKVFNGPPWNENWSAASALARLTEIMHTPGFLGLKATSEGRMLGFVMGHTEARDSADDYFLQEMCILPDAQRQGIGSALLDELKKVLISKRTRSLYLLTSRDCPAARFYEKNGFRISDRMVVMTHRLETQK